MKRTNGKMFFSTVIRIRANDLETDTNVANQLKKFFAKHGDAAIAVSFSDWFPEQFSTHHGCKMWREVFPYQQNFFLWENAYETLDKLLPRFSENIRSTLEPFYHDCARMLHQENVLDYCRKKMSVPICILITESFPAIEGEMGTKHFNFRVKTLLFRLGHLLKYITRATYGFILKTPVNIKKILKYLMRRTLRLKSKMLFKVNETIRRTHQENARELIGFMIETPISAWNKFKLFLLRFAQLPSKIFFVEYESMYSKNNNKGSGGISPYILKKMREAKVTSAGIVITVEDSGTMVNYRPTLEILKVFNKIGVSPIVLTTCEWIASSLAEEVGAHIFVLTQKLHKKTFFSLAMIFTQRYKFRRKMKKVIGAVIHDKSEKLFISALADRVYAPHGFDNYRANINAFMNALHFASKVYVLLTVYEVLPISVSTGNWALKHDIPWIGFFPILVGDRPDGHHFPAPVHLVYGEQLQDLILRLGQPPESVQVVGTPTYDVFFGRNKVADRVLIESQFPKVSGKKLVVVATEAFPDPLVELGPVLNTLACMEDIHVVLKVHPSDSQTFFQHYVDGIPENNNITVIKNCDLAALLNSAELMICIISNIIISAAVLGIPNLVCDFSQKSRVIDFVKEGLCFGCYSPEDIRENVLRLLFNPTIRAEAMAKIRKGARRFNGLNDGQSAVRIANYILARVSNRVENEQHLANRSHTAEAS